MAEQESPERLEIINPQMFKNRPRVFGRILFIFFISVGMIVFALMFLVTPHKVFQGDNVIFQDSKIYFSEKISYLLHDPQVGDRIVFTTLQNSFEMNYIGLIVEIKQEGNSMEYMVLSKSTSSRPWIITRDKVKSRIYFPSSSKILNQKVISEGAWKITPSPIPMQLPVSGSKEYNSVPLSSDWIKYEPKNKEYSFFHQSNLKEEANSYDGNVTFSLADKGSEEVRYLEVFVKKIVLKPGEDAGSVIYKDTGLSSVPTFQKMVINNSISGFEISRSVDNFTRQLKVVYLPSGNSVYSISMRTQLPTKDFIYDEIFEKILGSFKFTY